MLAFEFMDKQLYQYVIVHRTGTRLVARQLQYPLYIINHIARYLWRQYAKVVGDDYEDNTDAEPDAILPEILIECF